MKIRECFEDFWKDHPALLIGIHLLLGAAAVLHFHWIYLLALLLLWIPLFTWKRALLHVALAGIAFAYTTFLYPPFSLPENKASGTIDFSISSLSTYASPFNSLYLYKGTVTAFNGAPTRLACRIYLPIEEARYTAHTDYKIEGTLIEKGERNYLFKPKKKTTWQPIANTFSAAEWRHLAKEKVKAHLKKQIPHPRSCAFLTALFTGELDERELSLEFSHLGLQHILAISGFHFAILAAFIGFFLRLFFSYKTTALILLIAITAYFIFIGAAPSVQRGWIALAVLLIGQIANLRCSGCNALGVGLVLAIAVDPLLITHLGFQLSFLATSAIFLLYPSCNRLLEPLLPKRPLSVLTTMPRLDQHGYLLSAFIRETFALSLAVHLFVLPVVLFTFHKFPLLSLLYNLFFPLWTSCVFLLFLFACVFTLIVPPLGSLFHVGNSYLTSFLLEFTANPPPLLDISLHTASIPFVGLISFLTLLFLSSIFLYAKRSSMNDKAML
jgi:ComEC/Rec2-related protein